MVHIPRGAWAWLLHVPTSSGRILSTGAGIELCTGLFWGRGSDWGCVT